MTNNNFAKLIRIVVALTAVCLPASIAHAQEPMTTDSANLLAGNCSVVQSRKSLPEEIKTAFASATKQLAFSLADPGETFQATDVYSANHPPLRRLIFAGECNGRWFVYYEHGGRGLYDALLVFSADHPPTHFSGSVVFGKPDTLEALRSILTSGKPKVFESAYW